MIEKPGTISEQAKMPSVSAEGHGPSLVVVGIALVLLSLLIAYVRSRSYDEPLDRDLAAYAVIGHEMLGGRSLYADLWDHKPPAIHVTFAAAEWVWGYGPQSIYGLGVAVAILTLWGVYLVGAAYCGSRESGLWAAVFWALLASNLDLQANQPNTEAFINLFMIFAFALLARAGQGGLGWGRAVLIGALFGLASLYKQIAVAPAVLVCLVHFWFSCKRAGKEWRSALASLMVVFGVIGATWLGVFAYFAWRGHWADFYGTVFAYNRYYGGCLWLNFVLGLLPDQMLGHLPLIAPLLCGLTAVGVVLGIAQKDSPVRLWALWCALALGTHLAVVLPGKGFAHYYQLWLPVLAVGAAWSLASFQQLCSAHADRLRGWIGQNTQLRLRLLALLPVGQLLLVLVATFRLSPDDWSRAKFGPRFVDMKPFAETIGEALRPDETLYVFGPESEIYYYSQRRPGPGVLYNYPLLGGPFADSLSARTLAELERAPVDMVVICFDKGPLVKQEAPDDPAKLAEWIAARPVAAWCLKHYVRYSGLNAGAGVRCYVRRGSDLAERLKLSEASRPESEECCPN